jgi:hypothetical protein
MAFLFKTLVFAIIIFLLVMITIIIWRLIVKDRRTPPKKGSEEFILLERMKQNSLLGDQLPDDIELWDEILAEKGQSIHAVLEGKYEITYLDLIEYSKRKNR